MRCELESSLEIQAKLFRGLADESRLSILRTLRRGPHTVGEIMDATGLTQSNTSNHLGCLRDCALVNAERDGRFVRYELGHALIKELLDMSDSILALAGPAMKRCNKYRAPSV